MIRFWLSLISYFLSLSSQYDHIPVLPFKWLERAGGYLYFVNKTIFPSRIKLSLLILGIFLVGIFAPYVSFSQAMTGSSGASNKNYIYHQTTQPSRVTCHCVVFRMDDVQDGWIETAQLAAMNVFITKNQSLTLGLIMNSVGNDSKIIGQINLGRDKGLFELALHGWDHVDYTKLSEQQQRESLRIANEKMERIFGNASNIFITPYGPFNNGTIQAMKQIGLSILSASIPDEERFDHARSILYSEDVYHMIYPTAFSSTANSSTPVYHLPAMSFFGFDEKGVWIPDPLQRILSDVDNNIVKYGYAVIVLHPQDLVQFDKTTGKITNILNTSRIKDLSQLVDHILSKGIRIVSFARLLNEVLPLPDTQKLIDINHTNENSNYTKLTREQLFSSLDASEMQQWVSQQSNTRIRFAYFPAVPVVGNFTDLRFVVEDLKTGANLKNLSARVSILSNSNNTVGTNNTNPTTGSKNPGTDLGSRNDIISTAKLNSSSGDFSLKQKFMSGGLYQVILRVNLGTYPLALASFDLYVL